MIPAAAPVLMHVALALVVHFDHGFSDDVILFQLLGRLQFFQHFTGG